MGSTSVVSNTFRSSAENEYPLNSICRPSGANARGDGIDRFAGSVAYFTMALPASVRSRLV